MENRIQEIIFKTIFTKGVYPKLFLIYKKRHLEQDGEFLKKCKQFEKFTLSCYGVKPRFRLLNLKSPYNNVILLLKTLENQNTIDEKIKILADSISEISNSVTDYYKSSKEFTTEQLTLGAEDMCPIFIYCLVQAQITSIYTIFNMLGELVDDNQIRGSAGYCLATLETCMNEIMIFQYDEFEKLNMPSPIIDSKESLFKTNEPPFKTNEPPFKTNETPFKTNQSSFKLNDSKESPNSEILQKPPLHPIKNEPKSTPININTSMRKNTTPIIPVSPKPNLKVDSPKPGTPISNLSTLESTPPQREAPRRPSIVKKEIEIDDIFNDSEDVSYLDETSSFEEWFNKK